MEEMTRQKIIMTLVTLKNLILVRFYGLLV